MTARNAQDAPGAYKQAIHGTGAFGDTLRALRAKYGVTQYRLGKLGVCDHSYISRLESGDRMPSHEFVLALCNALDATPDERTRLMEAAGYYDGTPGDVATFRALPSEVRTTLLKIGEMMTRPGAA